MRYKLTVEYLGTGLAGWQKVPTGRSVQAALEEAALHFCGETVSVTGAGRTDAGVHARAQTAHMDLPRPYPPLNIMQGLNYHLAVCGFPGIAVIAAEEAADDFHARFSARARHYCYRIINRRPRLSLEAGRAWHVPWPLHHAAMHDAAQSLVGHHDFTSFRDSRCQAKSPQKTVVRLEVKRSGEEILIHAEARSFLHHQVRIMVGTLKLVGAGHWTAEDVRAALAARNRAAAGPTAPPDGLYLMKVDY